MCNVFVYPVCFSFPVTLELLYSFFFPSFNFICDVHLVFFCIDTIARLVAVVVSMFLFFLSHFPHKFRNRLVTIES